MEKELQAAVVALARLCGWRLIYHTHDSRRSAAGFPDLVMLRPPEPPLFVEVKSGNGKLRPEQQEWLTALQASGCRAVVWRPVDWTSGRIEAPTWDAAAVEFSERRR